MLSVISGKVVFGRRWRAKIYNGRAALWNVSLWDNNTADYERVLASAYSIVRRVGNFRRA